MSATRDVADAAAVSPIVREVGTTPPSNAPDLSMMSLIASFLAKEPVVAAGYAVTLLLATVVSIVGLSSITSKLYASINAGTRQTSMGLVLALGGMLCTLWGLNYGVDALDAHLRPSFQSFAYKSFLERIVKNNEEDFVDVPPLAYTNMTKVGTNTAMCIFTQMLRSYVPTAILVVVVTAFVLSINYKAGVAFIVALAAVGAIAAFVGPKVHAAAVKNEDDVQALQHELHDNLSSLDTVVARNQGPAQLESLSKTISQWAKNENAFVRTVDGFGYGLTAVLTLGVIAAVALAVGDTTEGVTSGGGAGGAAVASAVLAVTVMMRMHMRVSNASAIATGALRIVGRSESVYIPTVGKLPPTPKPSDAAVLQRLEAQLMAPAPAAASAGAAAAATTTGASNSAAPVFEVRNLTFSYRKPVFTAEKPTTPDPLLIEARSADGPPVLKALTRSVGRGITAIVARSGRGKSTLASLLAGCYSADSYTGDILFMGEDARKIARVDLRKRIILSKQSQHVLGVGKTIRDTLMFGNNGATEEQLQAVWTSIAPNFAGRTLESMVGINAANLSTGQLQLLRLGQVQLSAQPVIILDEPTSGIDVNKKPAVIAAIRALAKTRVAVLLITHDDDTASIADDVWKL